MTCPDPSALEAFALGSTSEEDRPRLESHIDGCPTCSEVVAQLAQIYGRSAVTMQARSADGSLRPPSAPALGAIVGRYRVGRMLGAGGMGVVFEAHDPELDRLVAIKLLHGGAHALALKTRLLREARAMARLAHPNVVAVHDVGTVGQQVFIAMELVEGTTLSRWMQAQPRSRSEVLRVMVEAGRGLEAAHRVGMVHRDFKPDNVLIGADGRPRVTDFGLARPEDGEEPAQLEHRTAPGKARVLGMSLTRTAPGAIVGTPAYMAPEQFRAQATDARSDQFAFCVVLYETLFGRRPFAELAQNVLLGRLVPVPSSAPRWLRELVERGLSLDPGRRHASMTELLAELERERGRGRRILLSLAAMAAGAATMVGALYLWMGPRESEGAAPSVAASASAATAASCDERSLMREHWNEPRRAALGRELSRRAYLVVPDATHVLRVLDGFSAVWQSEHARLCSDRDDKRRAQRRTCLARRFRDFDALVSYLLDEKDASAVEQAYAAVEHLSWPNECSSSARLAVQPKDPDDPAVLAKVELLGSDLARLRAKLALGQAVYERGPAAKLVDEAKALAQAPLLAEALLLQGRVLFQLDSTDEAATQLEAAVAVARGAGHDEVITGAAKSLVEVETRRLRSKNAERWLRIVANDAARFDDKRLATETALLEGALHRAIGEYADARAAVEQALEQRRDVLGDQHLLVAEARIALSALLLDLEEPDDALKQAEEALRVSLSLASKDSLEVASAKAAVGRALVELGKHREALEHLERASNLQVLGMRHDHREPASVTAELVAEAREALGERDKADKAIASSALGRKESWRYAISLTRHGDILLRRGDHAGGLELHRQAVAHLEGIYGEKDLRLVAALRGLGRAEAAAGKIGDARRTLGRALALVNDELGYEPLLAFVHDDLAFVEHGAKNASAELKHRDEAHVLTSSAYGHDHPVTTAKVLARADLAWDLGDEDYAGRLYRGVADRLAAQRGEDHPDTARARSRASPPDEPVAPAPSGPTKAEIKKQIMDRVREISR
jgi:tetratricopeptide (TPR) repeat protein